MKLEFLFYVHTVFMIIAFVIMLISISFVIRKKKNWFTKHKRGMTLAIISMFLGISSMVTLKLVNGFSHFSTIHSRTGLGIFLTAIVVLIVGNFMKDSKIKLLHKIIGSLVVLTGIITIFGKLLD